MVVDNFPSLITHLCIHITCHIASMAVWTKIEIFVLTVQHLAQVHSLVRVDKTGGSEMCIVQGQYIVR